MHDRARPRSTLLPARRAPRAALAAALALLAAAPAARAVDVWTEPNPGVRHLQRSGVGPAEYHVLVVSLAAPGVAIRCTTAAERWQTTSGFGRRANLAAAINGGFWSPTREGEGLAAGGGEIWSSDDERLGFFAVGPDGRAWISRPSDVVQAARRGVTNAVSGRPLLIDRGQLSDEMASFSRAYAREPRTVVGVSQDGRTVFLLTVDGRRLTSRGATLPEVAEVLLSLGVWRALNLDGGGSTSMFVAAEGGQVNRPSERTERVVINHLGVVAPAPAPAPSPAPAPGR